MNVTVYGYKYNVWDYKDPDKRRFLVTKGKRCSCGYVKCEHVKAVGEYLGKGGKRAPDEPYDARPSFEERIARIRALRSKALEQNTLSDATNALILAQRVSCEEDGLLWIRVYSLPQMWPMDN